MPPAKRKNKSAAQQKKRRVARAAAKARAANNNNGSATAPTAATFYGGSGHDASLRGPSDSERQFSKWDAEKIDRFLQHAEFSSEEDDDADVLSDADLQRRVQPMPQPRQMDEVYNSSGGAGGGGAGDQTALLAKMLNPDAGGRGRNTNGIAGLLARDQPADPRARLRQRLRDMRRRRGKWADDDYARDARGRKIPGARQVTVEDLQAGRVPRNVKIDKQRSATQRQQMVAKLREQLAERKAEAAQRQQTVAKLRAQLAEREAEAAAAAPAPSNAAPVEAE